MKIRESEMINKHLDHAREQKKLWNMKVMVIPIIIDALGTVPKGLGKRLAEFKIRERIETSPQHCWDRLQYWEESWRPEKTWRHSDSSEKPNSRAGVKNSQGVNNNSVMLIAWSPLTLFHYPSLSSVALVRSPR